MSAMTASGLIFGGLDDAVNSRDAVEMLNSKVVWSYGDLMRLSALYSQNLIAGQTVAFLIDPGPEYVGCMLACWRSHCTAMPLATMHPAAELIHYLEDSRCATVITTSQYKGRLEEAMQSVATPPKLVVLDEDGLVGEGVREKLPAEVSVPSMPSEQDGCLILYTSGTTSKPKGVLHTQASVGAQMKCLMDAWGWEASDSTVHCLPLHHIHGIVNILLCALASRAKLMFPGKFDAAVVVDVLASGRCSVFMAVPTVYHKLLQSIKAKTSRDGLKESLRKSVRLMVCGSAALPLGVMMEWAECTGHCLLERYGMSEIGMALSNDLLGWRLPSCVGTPLPGVEVRIVSKEEGGALKECGVGEAGELLVKGRNVFAEYIFKAKATQDSFTPDGWFLTGDTAICVQVADDIIQAAAKCREVAGLDTQKGRPSAGTVAYKIMGRSSVDIIKSGGYKLSALEIESALTEMDFISEAAVVGLEDEEWGEVVGAVLVVSRPTTLEEYPVSPRECQRQGWARDGIHTQVGWCPVSLWDARNRCERRASSGWRRTSARRRCCSWTRSRATRWASSRRPRSRPSFRPPRDRTLKPALTSKRMRMQQRPACL